MTDPKKEITENETIEKETLDELAELDANLDEVRELLEDEDLEDEDLEDEEDEEYTIFSASKKKILLFAGIVLGLAAAAAAIAIVLSKKDK